MVVVVPRGYLSARSHAIRCNALLATARRIIVLSASYPLQRIAANCSELHGNPLLTGWSLVRIRPGEPIKFNGLGRIAKVKIRPGFASGVTLGVTESKKSATGRRTGTGSGLAPRQSPEWRSAAVARRAFLIGAHLACCSQQHPPRGWPQDAAPHDLQPWVAPSPQHRSSTCRCGA